MRLPEIKSNLHTHSTYCDGKNTIEETTLAAIAAGMEVLGFSGHAEMPFASGYAMSPEGTKDYRKEILHFRELYADQITLLLGLEVDFYSILPQETYDYLIGSVHYVCFEGDYTPVDDTPQAMADAVKNYCGGDWYRYACAYYETVAQVVDRTHCDIVGHFDLMTKFIEVAPAFEENHPRYLRVALEALDALLEKDVIFEVNTGAISRGYRRTPYPSPILLRRIAEKRGRVTLSSDAHAKENLLFGFDDACRILRASGIGSVEVMGRNGWRTVPL